MTRLPAEFLTIPIAHRALHDVRDGRPENSLAAISAAVDAGYGIEIDVQLSSDNAAIVFHDYDLGRLTAHKGPVRMRSARALGQIVLTGSDEGIPTLAEVLDLVGGRVPVLIEIKDQDGAMGNNVGALEQAVALALASYAGPVAVMSFNPHAVDAFARYAPNVPRGLVTDAFAAKDWQLVPASTRARLRDVPDYDALGASFVSHQASDLARARIGDLKAAGADILCWTIRSQGEEVSARQIAQNITFEGYLAAITMAKS
jgi:glycerophosphoryl diester phosphodiesterase